MGFRAHKHRMKMLYVIGFSLVLLTDFAFAQPQSFVLEAEDGLVLSPFIVRDGYIFQETNSPIDCGGKAVYSVDIEVPGQYAMSFLINATDARANSVGIGIDIDPINDTNEWVIPITKDFEEQVVRWPASAVGEKFTFGPIRYFELDKGQHRVVLRGKTGNVRIDRFNLGRRPDPPMNLRLVSVDEYAFDPLFNHLNDQDPKVRHKAIESLLGKDLTGYLPHLTASLTNKDAKVRRFALTKVSGLGEGAYKSAHVVMLLLSDDDPTIRSNSVACLGNIGASASFASSAVAKLLHDSNESVRTAAAQALGQIRRINNDSLLLLGSALFDRSRNVRRSVAEALAKVDVDQSVVMSNLVSAVRRSDVGDRPVILASIEAVALRSQDFALIEVLPSIRYGLTTVSQVHGTNHAAYLTLQRSEKYLSLVERQNPTKSGMSQIVTFESGVPLEFIGLSSLVVNGTTVELSNSGTRTGAIEFLGEPSLHAFGLNWFENSKGSLARRFAFWQEEKKLKRYEIPYTNSHAIIVAIEDYSRSKADGNVGPTGYPQLTHMVSHARELSLTLKDLGFPQENIHELFDADATSTNITRLLHKFWESPESFNADRIFIYFGGHGATNSSQPCFVTYDFDPRRPTLTSILMTDVTGSHFDNITARQVMVAFDACYSGMALPKYRYLGDDSAEQKRLQEFRALSVVEAETTARARNILVAATGNQRAVWDRGGIFTSALVSGLKGPGDLNSDGIIQFDELSLFVRNEVNYLAGKVGEKQMPKSWSDNSAPGSIVFLRPPRLVRK